MRGEPLPDGGEIPVHGIGVRAVLVGPITVTSRSALKKIFKGWKYRRPSRPRAKPLMALK